MISELIIKRSNKNGLLCKILHLQVPWASIIDIGIMNGSILRSTSMTNWSVLVSTDVLGSSQKSAREWKVGRLHSGYGL